MNKADTIEAIRIWRPVQGFEGVYDVSNDGCIRRIARKNCAGLRNKYRLMSPSARGDGYLIIILYKFGIASSKYMHRLVAEVFIPIIKGKYHINHIDGIKNNNNFNNLEWCTAKENQKHASAMGLMRPPKGEDSVHSILTEKQARKIKYSTDGIKHKILAAHYGVTRQNIGRIKNSNTWKHI